MVKKNINKVLLENSELIECEVWKSFTKSIGEENAAKFGVSYKKFQNVSASILSSIDILAFNRVIYCNSDSGLKSSIDEIIAEYRRNKIPRFFFSISPHFLNNGLRDDLLKHGFTFYNNWSKLYRDNSPVKNVQSEMLVEQIGPGSSKYYSDIIITGFKWDESLTPLLVDFIRNGKVYDGGSGWIHYLGYYKHKPVAAASLYIKKETGWLGFAVTLKEYRRLGGQHALIRQRLLDGINNGVKHFVVETAQNLPEKKSQSYLNLLDMGFEQVYLRPNYIFNF